MSIFTKSATAGVLAASTLFLSACTDDGVPPTTTPSITNFGARMSIIDGQLDNIPPKTCMEFAEGNGDCPTLQQ